ncbi:MAG: nitroreductase family protein [Oligoflexia bacterium]|nr:nitroreductase family protein [Oligoflexia bacterium]
MEFFEAVKKRRSVRRFTQTQVPDSVVVNAIDAALIAPNSSNMQPWEFYWVKAPEKMALLKKACLSQPAATTAQHLVVAVSRVDTWKRNCKMMVELLSKNPKTPKSALDYYQKIVPLVYATGPFNLLGLIKKIIIFWGGFFRPTPRGPSFKHEVFEVVTKTTALACENLMLAVVAQGYSCCPMEGFDEKLVKKLLKLNCNSHVVMVIGIGEGDSSGIYGPQIRFDKKYFVFEV